MYKKLQTDRVGRSEAWAFQILLSKKKLFFFFQAFKKIPRIGEPYNDNELHNETT